MVKGSGLVTKVCFIVPPNPTAFDLLDPHLGILSIAAAVRELERYEVEYVEWGITPHIPEADIYGFTAYGVNYHTAVALADLCKMIHPNCTTVIGGPVASSLSLECLKSFDVVCVGEGEQAFLDFLESRKTGRFYFGRYTPYVQGTSPPPAYDLAKWSKYKRILLGQRAFGLVTSRGCPYNCAFCSNDRQWDSYRAQPCAAAIRDIQYCKRLTGFQAVTFWDNTFELRLSHEFLEALGRENIIFSYQSRGHVHDWNADLYRAGGRIVFVGVESGDDDMLHRMNKGLTTEQIRAAIHSIHDAGILVRCGIIFGFPGETPESLERTRTFVEELEPDQTFLTFFSPFPGSDVWRRPAKYGVTWMRPMEELRLQEKRGWVDATIETEWLSREDWNTLAPEMAEWWKKLPRNEEADHSWWKG